MKHLKRNLFLAAGILLLLTAGYFLAVRWEPAPADTDTPSQTTEKAVQISTLSPDQVTEIQVIRSDGSYTIKQTADGSFQLEGIPLTLSQAILAQQFGALSFFTSTRPGIPMDGREADFGLAEPAATVHLRTAGGGESFRLGAEVPGGDGYYFAPETGGLVYVLSGDQAERILLDLTTQKSTAILTLNTDAVTECTIRDHGTVTLAVRQYQEGDRTLNAVSPSFVMTAPYTEAVSASRLEEFLANFTEVTALSFVEDNASDESGYFSGTDYSVTFTQNGETHTLRLGDTDTAGNVYASLDANGSIFTVSPALRSAVQSVNPDYLLEKLVAIFMLDDLAAVDIHSGDKTYHMQASTSESDETYYLNGTATDKTAFQQAYQKAAGILFQEMYDGSVSGTPALTIVYTQKDGSQDTTRYYPLDERNYAAVRSNGTTVLVLKNYIDDVLQLLK